jgi:hypothetical protein
MTTHTKANGIIRPCCVDANLRTIERRPTGIVVRQCQVCRRKHYWMRADPGHIGAQGSQLGGHR